MCLCARILMRKATLIPEKRIVIVDHIIIKVTEAWNKTAVKYIIAKKFEALPLPFRIFLRKASRLNTNKMCFLFLSAAFLKPNWKASTVYWLEQESSTLLSLRGHLEFCHGVLGAVTKWLSQSGHNSRR